MPKGKPHEPIELDEFGKEEKRREEEDVDPAERRRVEREGARRFARSDAEIERISTLETQLNEFEIEMGKTELQRDALDSALETRVETIQAFNALTIELPAADRQFYSDRINGVFDRLQAARDAGSKPMGKTIQDWGMVAGTVVGAGAGVGALIATVVIALQSAKDSAKQQALLQLLQDQLDLTTQQAAAVKAMAQDLQNMAPAAFCNAVALNVVALKWSWASQYSLTTVLGIDIPTYGTSSTVYAVTDVLALEQYVCDKFNQSGKYQTIWVELNKWLSGNATSSTTVNAIPGDKSLLTLRQVMFLVEGILSTLKDKWKANPETLPTNPCDPITVSA